jgi:hypothetical protein
MRLHGLAWDADQEVGHAFGGVNADGASLNLVIKLSMGGRQAAPVSRFPGKGRRGATAVWSPTEKCAYVFGGDGGPYSQADIHQFVPGGHVTKLRAKLPKNLSYAPAIYANDGQIYVVGTGSLMLFDPAALQAIIVLVDNYPLNLQDTAAVYVPKLNRIYIFGGWGCFEDPGKQRDWIGYIDLP